MPSIMYTHLEAARARAFFADSQASYTRALQVAQVETQCLSIDPLAHPSRDYRGDMALAGAIKNAIDVQSGVHSDQCCAWTYGFHMEQSEAAAPRSP